MRTLRSLILVVIPLLSVMLVAQPAPAAHPDQTSIVSDNPANNTPQVLNGHVNALVQVGDTVYVGGVFANVTLSTTATVVIPKANIFAYSASTGQIDPSFTPVLTGGGVNDMVVAPDGQSMWVSGFFNKVNGAARPRRSPGSAWPPVPWTRRSSRRFPTVR